MRVSEFLVVASFIFSGTVFDRCAEVRSGDADPRESAVDDKAKIKVELGDIVGGGTAPRGGEYIIDADSIFKRFNERDDVAYWESIYGPMADIPESDEPPSIAGKTVELTIVTKWEDDLGDENSAGASDDKKSEASMKNSVSADGSTRALETKASTRVARNSGRDRCEITNPLYESYPVKNTETCEKTENSVRERHEAILEETPKSDSNRNEKSTIPSWLRNMWMCEKTENSVAGENEAIVEKTPESDSNRNKKSATPLWWKNTRTCEKREVNVSEKKKDNIEKTSESDVNQKKKYSTPSWLDNTRTCQTKQNGNSDKDKPIIARKAKSDSNREKQCTASSLFQSRSKNFRSESELQSFDPVLDAEVDADEVSAGDVNAAGESPLIVDSRLDISAKKTNAATDVDRASRSRRDLNERDGESDEDTWEDFYRRSSGSTRNGARPNSRFEYTARRETPYVCETCRQSAPVEPDTYCPMCAMQDDDTSDEVFPYSATDYRRDGYNQNYRRSVDPTRDIESHPKYKRDHDRYVNSNDNHSNETFRRSSVRRDLDNKLRTPRDGKPVPVDCVRTHLSHGHDIALDLHERARFLWDNGFRPCPHTPSMLHFYDGKVSEDLVTLNEKSDLILYGTRLLQHKLSVYHNMTTNVFLKFLKHFGFRITGDQTCSNRWKRCGKYNRFRSFDGCCNNVDHPIWGQSNQAFARILPTRYSDGIHGMPVSVTGAELPNPRKLSVRLYSRKCKPDAELTLAIVQWGQTVAHDLGRQIMDQTARGGIACCTKNGKRLPKILQHHSCEPITISPDDKFYSRHGQRCMNFVRAMTISKEDGSLGPADQLNGVTSFLDCSPMYGSDKKTLDELREFTGGRMKVEFRCGRWMLPTMKNRSHCCDTWSSDDVCYKTGDPRNNQNPQLVILQTLLVREHNRVADALSALNEKWNDARIFQETRRIVIAEYQHITYNEWLPLLLGRKYAKSRGLIRTQPGMSHAYDGRVNPTTIIAFTTGAFRSLHSMIEGNIGLWDVEGDVIDTIRLSDHFSRPKIIERNDNFDNLLRGLAAQRMQKQDMSLHPELTEYLFRSANKFGMDLAALDIQRGRDHGMPGYNAYREVCGLEKAKNFDDLSAEISLEDIEKLRRNYAHVDDIDFIVGATMERRVPGSTFGPTNRCLIGEQFYRSRVGDRYFYDNANFSHSFTPEQFSEITKATLSGLLCGIGDAIAVIQRNAFRVASFDNPLVSCKNVPKLNLRLWKEL